MPSPWPAARLPAAICLAVNMLAAVISVADEPGSGAIGVERACDSLLAGIERTRSATRRMLAQLDEQRKRAEEMSGSLTAEYRQQLEGLLKSQEAQLSAVLKGLDSITCRQAAPTGSTGPKS